MSREIKFRAWLKPRWDDDEDAGKMYYDVQNSYDTLGDVKPYDIMNSFDQWLDDEVAIVEQYTGLKDKNGKEVYEGDIVKGDMGVFEVKWYDLVAQFMFRPNMSMKYHPPFTSTQLEVMEVIGNIHENGELLGGEE